MNLVAYIDKINQATEAKTLHGLRVEATYDTQVTEAERAQIGAAICNRFCKLNAEAAGTPQPRWRAPIRNPTAIRRH